MMGFPLGSKQLSRRALRRRTLVYYAWRFLTNGGRSARAMLSPHRHRDSGVVGRELANNGIAVGQPERFLAGDGRRALSEAAARVLAASRSSAVTEAIQGRRSGPKRKKDFLVHLVSYKEGMEADDPLLEVALDTKLLEIVAAYLGMWPCLHSVDAWLNFPTEAAPELSQLWHRDPEDLQLVKVFIYLSDVGDCSGPFTYVPQTQPFGRKTGAARRLDKHKRLPDRVMSRVFPPEEWRTCTGPAGTMILADTVGYHRGGKPLAGQRILVTFTYTSGSPITNRALWLRTAPDWASAAIQQFACRSLVGSRPTPVRRHDAM